MLADRKSRFIQTVCNKSKNKQEFKKWKKQKSTHPLMKWTEEFHGRKRIVYGLQHVLAMFCRKPDTADRDLWCMRYWSSI